MAVVYVLYSPSLNKYYIGSCKTFVERLDQHLSHFFPNAFTSKTNDWETYFIIEQLSYSAARKIECHLKKMKSRKYFEDLKKYPEIIDRLRTKFSNL